MTATILSKFNNNLIRDGYDPETASDAVPLAAFVVGPNIKKIATFLGKPRPWVAPVAHRLRDQNVWVGDTIIADPENIGVEMALHTMVAAGVLNTSAEGYSA
jgi:energy-converting hydrogenase Eha subunit F